MLDRPSHFRPDIEGLRAIAVLGVLLFHAGVPAINGGFVGVDVFYVISGFLITQLMLRDLGTQSSLQHFLADFYSRRIRRILPAATLVMIATLVGAVLVHNVLENAGLVADARSTTLFFSNVHFAHQAMDYFNAGKAPSPYLQYWSLSLEEQFYAVWPLVLFAVWKISRSRAVLAGIFALVVLASFWLNVFWMKTEPVSAFYLLPSRAWELGAGALLAISEPRVKLLGRTPKLVCGFVGLALIGAGMLMFTDKTAFPGCSAALPAAGTVLAIASGCGESGFIQRALAIRPMQVVGRYSFSLYLWHWPLLVLKVEHFKWLYTGWPIRTAFMLVVSLPVAAFTFHLIEDPIRRSRMLRTSSARSLAFGIGLVGLGLLAIAAVQLQSEALDSGRPTASSHGTLGAWVVPTDFVPSNLQPPLAESENRDYVKCGHPCVVGSPQRRRRIVLFGNSHAGHWGPAFQDAGETLDARIEIYGPGSCASFLFQANDMSEVDKASCTKRRDAVFASIVASPPDMVVLSNLSADVYATRPSEWESGVRNAIHRLPATTKVVVLSDTPKAKFWVPTCLAANLETAQRCDVTWPAETNAKLSAIVNAEGATFVDLRGLFCTADRCPAITRDTLIYSDSDHVTVRFARSQATWFARTLGPLF